MGRVRKNRSTKVPKKPSGLTVGQIRDALKPRGPEAYATGPYIRRAVLRAERWLRNNPMATERQMPQHIWEKYQLAQLLVKHN